MIALHLHVVSGVVGVLSLVAAFASSYDETVWTRQRQTFQLPFPAQLVLSNQADVAGFSLNSQTGPYDPSQYSKDTVADSGRHGHRSPSTALCTLTASRLSLCH